MGNSLSITNDFQELGTCPMCNTGVYKNNYYTYIDMQCSKCKQRCREYSHSECFTYYQQRSLHRGFRCFKCEVDNNNNINLL